jgi:predicted DCC family thiol-disulfide oxidoreductase YuxK
VDWVRARDPAGRVLALPNQTPGLAQRLGLSRAQVARELWAFARDGRASTGAAGINAVLRELGGPWAGLAAAGTLPGLAWCEERAYRWFARHRSRFARWGVTPECDRPGVPCEG